MRCGDCKVLYFPKQQICFELLSSGADGVWCINHAWKGTLTITTYSHIYTKNLQELWHAATLSFSYERYTLLPPLAATRNRKPRSFSGARPTSDKTWEHIRCGFPRRLCLVITTYVMLTLQGHIAMSLRQCGRCIALSAMSRCEVYTRAVLLVVVW